jgi:hypothetical protein
MKGGWTAVDDILHEPRQGGTSGPVTRKLSDLLLRWDFTSGQEPEETFRKRLRTTGSFRKKFLTFRDSFSAETDSLLYEPCR